MAFVRRAFITRSFNQRFRGPRCPQAYIRQGSRPVAKKVKKKEREEVKKAAPQAQAQHAAVPEDDIFDDAGAYDLSMRAAAAAPHGHGRR